jgi:hypothetical protein
MREEMVSRRALPSHHLWIRRPLRSVSCCARASKACVRQEHPHRRVRPFGTVCFVDAVDLSAYLLTIRQRLDDWWFVRDKCPDLVRLGCNQGEPDNRSANATEDESRFARKCGQQARSSSIRRTSKTLVRIVIRTTFSV